jgi:hypothetical protein
MDRLAHFISCSQDRLPANDAAKRIAADIGKRADRLPNSCDPPAMRWPRSASLTAQPLSQPPSSTHRSVSDCFSEYFGGSGGTRTPNQAVNSRFCTLSREQPHPGPKNADGNRLNYHDFMVYSRSAAVQLESSRCRPGAPAKRARTAQNPGNDGGPGGTRTPNQAVMSRRL